MPSERPSTIAVGQPGAPPVWLRGRSRQLNHIIGTLVKLVGPGRAPPE